MRLRQVAWNMHEEAEVGGVTSGGKDTFTLGSLVERALINVLEVDCGLQDWLEPHHDHAAVEDLGVRLSQNAVHGVPLATFEVHTVAVDTLWWGGQLLNVHHVVNNFEVHSHSIDRNLHLSGVVLEGTSEEAVSEVELVNPEVLGDLSVNPVLEELNALLQILGKATKRLK